MIANVLSIAGSDPSGGAGIQADLKTFSALGCYGMAAITALTAQNTRGVTGVHIPEASFIVNQIDTVFADVRVDAVKIGMLASGEIARAVGERLKAHGAKHIVLDPVLVATSGDSLGSPDVVDAMREFLFPLAEVITPNIPEAVRLADGDTPHDAYGLEALARRLEGMGANAALVKGGHLLGDIAADVLFIDGKVRIYEAPWIDTKNTHGTGCTLSSAIASFLARGQDLPQAIASAKDYLTNALRGAHALGVGGGHGPVHHFNGVWK
ncbi:MAG: bifunctional hydroxymethylpyrimidine kinase/phosphomethylpyrimidine kinase [Alphaproteobacteria bacterium]|nr:bifunctional hydroxymethylpyrimidine kinase/phosphomethylpyrimidine kinase [Alphaproteobacteria bacterium]